jgi:hypothetical protein
VGRVFNYRSGRASTQISTCTSSKQPNLLLKTQPKQVLGYLRLALALPDLPENSRSLEHLTLPCSAAFMSGVKPWFQNYKTFFSTMQRTNKLEWCPLNFILIIVCNSMSLPFHWSTSKVFTSLIFFFIILSYFLNFIFSSVSRSLRYCSTRSTRNGAGAST